MLSVYELDEKKRRQLVTELTGVPRTLEFDDGPPKIEKWAPAWWNGDDDATASNMAAMAALKRG